MHVKYPFFLKNKVLFSAILLGLSSIKLFGFTTGRPIEDPLTQAARFSDENNQLTTLSGDFRYAAKKAIPSVVSIKVEGKKKKSPFGATENGFEEDFFNSPFWRFFNLPEKESSRIMQGQGSGVIISSDGYILTNSHVVHDMDNIHVQMTDGREFTAKFIGEDPNIDLALIKIDAVDLPFLTLGDSSKLEIGQWVAAVGNPVGLQATFTVGVVSAKGRSNLDIVRYEDFIQTDAPITRGNSGGPLLNMNGEIVGINTAIATNVSAGYIGIGFAIPSNMAKYVIDEIRNNGKVERGFLGVSLQSINYNLAQALDLKKAEGALVTSVLKGSPAEKAGLQVEDVILKYNDQAVENDAVLRNGIYMLRPGTKITLTVSRAGKILTLPVEVGAFQEKEESVGKPSVNRLNDLGIEVEDSQSSRIGQESESGVVVTKVDPHSIAARTGIKKGMSIMSVNRVKTNSKAEFDTVVSRLEKGKPVLIHLKQGEVNFFISIQTSGSPEEDRN